MTVTPFPTHRQPKSRPTIRVRSIEDAIRVIDRHLDEEDRDNPQDVAPHPHLDRDDD